MIASIAWAKDPTFGCEADSNESTDSGIMMPESGRKLVHKEGVELIRDWIQLLKSN